MRSGNPALRSNVFQSEVAAKADHAMTLQGTVIKSGLLLTLTIASAACSWIYVAANTQMLGPVAMGGAIVGLIIALITIFKPNVSPYTAPLYAVVEGLFLGAISLIYENRFPGMVPMAVGLTFGTLAALLLVYTSGVIKVTQNFRLGIMAATGGIFLVYMVTWIGNIFGFNVPYIHGNGWIGIGFSLFVVVIAALNLVLDFDFIESGVEYGAPKYMEWYGAFGLLVTLVWLYLEILRLLAKLQSRD